MKTCIKALAYYLPETVVTNEQLVEEFPEWTVEKIAAKVGVNQRHIARDETISDMAVKAAEKMFVQYRRRLSLGEQRGSRFCHSLYSKSRVLPSEYGLHRSAASRFENRLWSF